MPHKLSNKYADLSPLGRLGLLLQLAKLPIVLTGTLLLSPFVWYNKHKTWRRVLSDKAFRWAAHLPIPAMQNLFGTSLGTYNTTMAKLALPSVVEELGDDARLMWIGPKRTDRVLLYLHGGAFLAPVEDIAIYFWKYVQDQLKAQPNGFDLGIVILNYTLIPEASFPTPLRQAVAAITHLTTTSGVKPENLHLAGDSAGGNLVLQVLLHSLRPVPSVDPLKLSAPLRGAYTISPWVSLTGDTGSHAKHSDSDIISQRNLREWGSYVLAHVPESQRGYVEAVKAPEELFDGLEKVVDRVLITAGGQECLKEDIVQFYERLKGRSFVQAGGDLKLVVQNGGVHNDMFMDFLAKATEVGELTPMIVSWIAAGYSTA